MRMIEAIQITLIHIGVQQLKLSDAAYRAILWGEFQTESSKNLTYAQGSQLLDRLQTMGFVIRPKCRTPNRGNFRRHVPCRVPLSGNIIQMMSIEQAKMIEALAGKIRWKFADGYSRWLRKYMQIDRVKTADKASDVIEGLKKLLEHQGGGEQCRTIG